MSREIALDQAIRLHAGTTATVEAVVATAEAFATFLAGATAAPRASRRKADAAPTETVAVSTPAADAPIETSESEATPPKTEVKAEVKAETPKAEETQTQSAAPAMTAEAFKVVLGKAASNPGVGPLKVREVLGTFTNPDTGKPAQNFTTLHASHYGAAAEKLNAALANAAKAAA